MRTLTLIFTLSACGVQTTSSATDKDVEGSALSDTGDGGVTVDDDRDGFTEEEGDCDDTLAALNPASTDIVGDDIDQNCDGVDGTDRDADGWASQISGGPDCNDEDSNIHPGAEDIPDDRIDQDCSGADAHFYTGGWATNPCDEVPVPTGESPGDITEGLVLGDQFGDTFTLADFCAGVVVIELGTAWDGPSRATAEYLQELYDDFGAQGLMSVFILVEAATRAPPEQADVEDFAYVHELTIPVLADSEQALYNRWGTGGYPQTVLLGPGMQILDIGAGPPTRVQIRDLLPPP